MRLLLNTPQDQMCCYTTCEMNAHPTRCFLKAAYSQVQEGT